MSLSTGFALGPVTLSVTGSEGWPPFLCAAALVAVAALPLLVVRSPEGGDPREAGERNLWRVLQRAPVPMIANLVFAATSGVLMTFMPLYGVSLGLSEAGVLMLVSVGAVGGIALQPLMGHLADRMSRYLLLAGLVGASLVGTALMPLLLVVDGWNYLYQFLAFGLRACIYGLSLTLLGERFRGAELASASAVFNLMWGLGSLFGPALGGLAMTAWPPHGMPASVALLLALLLPLALGAWWRQRRERLAHPPG
jgi:predicted MFS family arabinose efflux permease